MDLTKFAEPKSDQLNADDLIGGHIIGRIVKVTTDDAAQKVNVHLEGRRPWRPCKTTLRQLFAAWGTDGEKWVGRYVELKRDATVRFGGEDVGGIRIHALSHIPRPMDDKLTIAKGKKGAFRVEVLTPPKEPGTDAESHEPAPTKRQETAKAPQAAKPSTAAPKADPEPAAHHESWAKARPGFCAELGRLGTEYTYDNVADYCTAAQVPRPSARDNEGRSKLIAHLLTPAGSARFLAFVHPGALTTTQGK